MDKEFYILGDFNINLLIAGKYAPTKYKSNTSLSKGHPLLIKYRDVCSVLGLKQLIKEPTRLESLLDHVLTNCEEKISQSGVIPLGLSDHELIYCTRESLKAKFHTHKHVFTCSMKSYSEIKLVDS